MKTLSIAEVLMLLNGGGAVEELQSSIRETVQAVTENGGTGSVTLKLTIKKNGEEQVFISDTVTKTTPKRKSKETLFFVTDDHLLSRHDPRQAELFRERDPS